MQKSTAFRAIIGMFFVALAIAAWQEIKSANNDSPIGWPRPSRFMGVGIVYAMLGLLAEVGLAELAAVIAVGLVLGMVMQGSANGSLTTNGNLSTTPPAISTLQV